MDLFLLHLLQTLLINIFFLNMPPKNAIELIKNRENKFTHTEKKDIHERDEKHLEDSYNAACSLVEDYGWYEVKYFNFLFIFYS